MLILPMINVINCILINFQRNKPFLQKWRKIFNTFFVINFSFLKVLFIWPDNTAVNILASLQLIDLHSILNSQLAIIRLRWLIDVLAIDVSSQLIEYPIRLKIINLIVIFSIYLPSGIWFIKDLFWLLEFVIVKIDCL